MQYYSHLFAKPRLSTLSVPFSDTTLTIVLKGAFDWDCPKSSVLERVNDFRNGRNNI